MKQSLYLAAPAILVLALLPRTALAQTTVETDGDVEAQGFIGDGSQVTNVDAELLDNMDSSAFAQELDLQSAEALLVVLQVQVDALELALAEHSHVQPAVARINEINANISGRCDLIELRAISGGSMKDFVLQEHDASTLITFGDLTVQTGDLVVVHVNKNDATCNSASSGDETTSINEFPESTYPENYDTAWDWYSNDSGITNTDNVITLYDTLGGIFDAVFVSDAPTGTASTRTETQAAAVAAAGEWEMVGGGIPAGGFVDGDFNAHAVQDLNGTDTTASGTSIQRSDDTDSNTVQGWTMISSSWGLKNTGQLTP